MKQPEVGDWVQLRHGSYAATAAPLRTMSGLAAKVITKNGTTALVAGDIPSGAMVQATYDGTRFILGGINAMTPRNTGTYRYRVPCWMYRPTRYWTQRKIDYTNQAAMRQVEEQWRTR